MTLLLVLLTTLTLLFTCCGRSTILYFFGFFYPCFKTFQCLETKHTDEDDKKWLVYWVTFGLLMAIMPFLEVFFEYLPFPKILLTIFFFYLYCPLTNGYELLYEKVIRKINASASGVVT